LHYFNTKYSQGFFEVRDGNNVSFCRLYFAYVSLVQKFRYSEKIGERWTRSDENLCVASHAANPEVLFIYLFFSTLSNSIKIVFLVFYELEGSVKTDT
jgi:hypothetical protein